MGSLLLVSGRARQRRVKIPAKVSARRYGTRRGVMPFALRRITARKSYVTLLFLCDVSPTAFRTVVCTLRDEAGNGPTTKSGDWLVMCIVGARLNNTNSYCAYVQRTTGLLEQAICKGKPQTTDREMAGWFCDSDGFLRRF